MVCDRVRCKCAQEDKDCQYCECCKDGCPRPGGSGYVDEFNDDVRNPKPNNLTIKDIWEIRNEYIKDMEDMESLETGI